MLQTLCEHYLAYTLALITAPDKSKPQYLADKNIQQG